MNFYGSMKEDKRNRPVELSLTQLEEWAGRVTSRYLFLNLLTTFQIYEMEVEEVRDSQKDFQLLRLDFLRIRLVKASSLNWGSYYMRNRLLGRAFFLLAIVSEHLSSHRGTE